MSVVEFNGVRSNRAKHRGIRKAANSKPKELAVCRKIAVRIAKRRISNCCTANDVAWELNKRDIDMNEYLDHAAGALFKGSNWQWTGQFRKSTRVRSHSNLLKQWRYIGE